jgi:hypothetical protein
MRRLATAGAFALLICQPAVAAPLAYDEAVDGDIALSPILQFDFGTNVIRGNVRGGMSGSSSTFDADLFRADVPGGAVLDSVSVALTNTPSGNGSFPDFFTVSDTLSVQPVVLDVRTGGTFSQNVGYFPISDDRLTEIGLNSFPPGINVDYDIQITLTPAPIPLPAALPFLLTGCGVFGLLRWRRRALA